MEEKNEEVIEKITQEQTEQKEKPKLDESKFDSAGDDSVIKIDLDQSLKPKNNEDQEKTENSDTDNERVVGVDESTVTPQEQEEVQSKEETQESPTLEEVTNEEKENVEVNEEDTIEPIVEEDTINELVVEKDLPEDIEKLVNFMEETGGDLNDYVKLNQDYSKLDDQNLLHEYYKQTKPHHNLEEINFLMEEQFSFDEDEDEERDIKRKK